MSGKTYEGLNDQQVLESRSKNGRNLLTPPPKTPWWEMLLEKFEDPIIRILIFAVFVSFGVQFMLLFQGKHAEFFEPVGIIIAVLLATLLGFLNEFKASREFEVLNQFNEKTPVTVIRNGNHHSIPKDEIVVGDLVVVETGMEIPADGELLEAVFLQINESKLTGESMPVTKLSKEICNELKNERDAYERYIVLNGTTVANGHGLMLVTAVGDNTEIGKTARAAIETNDDKTPLEKELDKLAKMISVFAFSLSGMVFAALTLKSIFFEEAFRNLSHAQVYVSSFASVGIFIMLIPIWMPVVFDAFLLFGKEKEIPDIFDGKKGWRNSIVTGLIIIGAGLLSAKIIGLDLTNIFDANYLTVEKEILTFFMISVTLIVVSVPEGLPMSTTISLAYSMRKMMKQNVLTKRMLACETIGAVTTICTDKTGTLTMNEMRVFETEFEFKKDFNLIDKKLKELIFEAVSINSTANLDFLTGKPEVIGNPTEGAMLLWMNDFGERSTKFRSDFNVECQIPFNTENKYMATSGFSELQQKNIVHVKGAPEIILNHATTAIKDGKLIDVKSVEKEIKEKVLNFQRRGMRVIGFGYEEVADASACSISKIPPTLTWLGFIAISDPIRPEVPEAIRLCRKAGIEVKIVTGDNPLTAMEIGNQVGIEDFGELKLEHAITGTEFEVLKGKELRDKATELKILSRAKPIDKLTLVKELKASGKVVAVTGDGTNDAPAMNNADIGLAMGKTGTSIAKEAADMILLDDSFTSIVTGVMWGRSLYQNIQKFILFQLTVNVVAVIIALVGPFIGVNFPLTVIQMLWVNLIMDTFAALALSTEPPHKEIMDRPPRKPKDFIITKEMAVAIPAWGISFVIFLLGLLIWFGNEGITTKELTYFFSTFVFMQFWNLFNARCLGVSDSAFKGVKENQAFVITIVVIFIGQILMVQYGGAVFRTVPMSLIEWTTIIAGTSVVLWIGEIVRFVSRKKRKVVV